MTTELAIRPDQTTFDDKQLAALRALGVQNAPGAEIALFFHQAARTGLDPFARQIYLINRGGKYTIQVGIDGFRLIRDRKGNYQGHTEEWCGPDGVWKDVWLKEEPPAAARVSVYVRDYVKPVVGIALWSEYAQIGRDGKPQALWNPKGGKPALMLAKCAEALALRKAYPQDLSGLYTTDEIPEAEQDADGVYVTTTMRGNSNPNQNRPHNGKSGHASEREVQSRAVDERTPDAGKRPGRPRPAQAQAAGAADPTPADVVASEWISRIDQTDDLGALYKLHEEAAARHVLEHVDPHGASVEEAFLNRRQELQNPPESEQPVLVPDYTDETPF